MKDYICAIRPLALHKGLRELGLFDDIGEPSLGLPFIKSRTFTDDGQPFHFAIVRCIEFGDASRVHRLNDISALQILGEVKDSVFVWRNRVVQDDYERRMEVGIHRKKVPVLDVHGNYVVDENMELVTTKSTIPYRFGSFC